MRSRRHRIACLLAAAVLASPGAAWAQSAGDEQYEDPFGPEPEQEQPEDDGGGSGGGGTTGGGSDDGQSTPQTTPPPPAEPAPAPVTQTAQPPSAQPELPRTGADGGLIAAGGALLLVGGVALRVRLSERARSRR